MITIVPYRPAWPAEFEALGNAVRVALGDVALRVDHIGSTSVPGLSAKDVIDIQVTVRALDEPVETALRGAGYRRLEHIVSDHRPPGWEGGDEEWGKWFFRATDVGRPVNLHVRVAGRANQRYPLLFRDYLRAHSPVAQAYAQVKIALSRHHPDDVGAYYDIKDPVCDIIMGGAEAWAARVGWQQGPSDC